MNNFRDKLPFGTRPQSAANTRGRARRPSQREQEARQQRLFLIAVGVAAALVVLILAGGFTYEYFIKPNQVIAEVNGHQIKRRDYWKYQSVVLYQQARLYESYASQSTGQQQSQFLGFAQSLDAQRDKIWGSTDVSSSTVQSMIENQLYVDAAEEMGIDLSPEQVQLSALNTFAPSSAPLLTPIPTPTMIPARAEAATQTAEAALATPAPAEGTPGASGTPPAAATPITSSASPAASPVNVGSPVASPTTVPAGTPDPMSVADAQFTNFQNQVFDKAHMSTDDFYRLFAKPQLARELINAQLQNAVPQSAEQVHAEHILVATEDLAKQLYSEANGGASFEALARANSTDSLTAPTGGDLGWVTKGELDPATADAAFALNEGQISQPIQTAYGWELIKVVAKDPDRPLTDAQFEAARQKAVDTWLDQQRDEAKIKTDYKQTPTPTAGAYEPPVGAPTVPPATPIPTEAPPILGPTFGPEATPIGPNASPAAASPVASPVASPELMATPAA